MSNDSFRPVSNSAANSEGPGPARQRRSHHVKTSKGAKRLYPRQDLFDSALDRLDSDGLIVFCSERGLGRHSLALQIQDFYDTAGVYSKWIRINTKSDAVAYRKVKQAITSCIPEHYDSLTDSEALFVIEGLHIQDEVVSFRLAKQIAGALVAGVRIVIILDPEYQYLLDELPSCRVFSARDFILNSREIRKWSGRKRGTSIDLIVESTHGIASLVSALNEGPVSGCPGSDNTTWNHRVDELYVSALRPALIEEEFTLRCALASFGQGDFEDLRAVGVRASSDLLYETAVNCPLFGIDFENSRFSCVPIDCEALRRILADALTLRAGSDGSCESVRSSLTGRIARRLISRGQYFRGGVLAWADIDNPDTMGCVAAHPLELVDSGHVGLVSHVVARVDGAKTAAARKVLELLEVRPPVDSDTCEIRGISCPARVGLQLELLELIRRVKGEEPLVHLATEVESLSARVNGSRSELTEKVYRHLRASVLWLEGSSLESFRELMLARRLREQDANQPSMFSAMLQCDFEALRRLIGDPESPGEAALYRQALTTLSNHAVSSTRQDCESLCELSGIVSGESGKLTNAARVISRWKSAGYSRLVAWAEIVTSLSDLQEGQYRRAYVRALQGWEACAEIEDAGDLRAYSLLARTLAVRGLGERLGEADAPKDVDALGCSPDVSSFVRLCLACAVGEKDMADSVVVEMRAVMPRIGVVSFASFVMRADKALGSSLSSMLPLSWTVRTAPPYPVYSRAISMRDSFEVEGRPRLRIDVLGGIEVCLDNERLPETCWRRRQAKVLLALLALAPDHLIQRHDAIAILWPEADLARGRENLYTVLSSLRASLGQTAVANQFILGEMGQIRLDTSLVSCDVDEFEGMARQIISQAVGDDEVVAMCVALEALYGAGSYVPSSDSQGRFRRRHEELARRYRDAMLVGVEAATRLRDSRQAAWFARNAKASA